MKHNVWAWMKSVLVVSLVSLGLLAQAADTARVYVAFKPGKHGQAKELIAQHQGVIHHSFDNLEAVAATLPTAAVQALKNNPNVDLVEEDPPRYLFATVEAPYGINMVQATDVWDADGNGTVDASSVTGSGIKIGVIDTGVFVGHSDFAGVSMSGYNGNLPWNQDGAGHGTHVCGTLCAALNGSGVVGVSPGYVQIFMVRVFDSTGAWAYSSTLLDAAQRCQQAGCKIISMSLGGAAPSITEQRGLDAIYNNGNGVLLIAAAGNAGNNTTSYPAGYGSVVSVAAIDSTKAVASFSQQNSDVELAGPGVGVLSTVPYIELDRIEVGAVTDNGGHIEFSGRGTASGALVDGGLGDTIGAWSGKVVLIQRGSIDFNTKVHNAQAGGAVAAVIYNNVAGGFSGTMGTGNSASIPAISLSQEDGTALKSTALGQTATVTSSVTMNVSGYDYYDGTSMATPHVSGVAALVWSSKLTATAGQIRSVLQSTAQDLGTPGRDNAYGYGLVRAKAAITALGGGGGSGDTTPPTISNVQATPVNTKSGTFKITWTTSEPATSVVLLTPGGTFTDNTLVTSHSMSFKGTRGATYTYSVSSTDAAGNAANAGPFTYKN